MSQLSFLPGGPGPVDLGEVSEDQRMLVELRDLLVEGPGECDPVRAEGESAPGLLINPGAAMARAALEAAMRAAHEERAVLVVHVVAHGRGYQADPAGRVRHLLHMWDTVAEPIDTEPESRGWDPYADIERRRPHCGGLSGLVLVVDACWASWAKEGVEAWSGVRGGLLSAVLAASGDEAAWDACLTRTVIDVLRSGLTAVQHPRRALVAELLSADIQPMAADRCRHQTPHLGGNEHHNPVLFVGRNRAAQELAARLGLDGPTAGLLLRLTRDYTEHAVGAIETALGANRVVCVVGEAGTGKSTLAAALRSPPEESSVPFGLVQAAGFVATASGVIELACSLRFQLNLLPGFEEAADRFRRDNQHRWEYLDVWQQELNGPLSSFRQPVRVLVDGLDQLDGTTHDEPVRLALARLLDEVPNVSLVVLGRTDPQLAGGTVVAMPQCDEATARRYLGVRGVGVVDHDRLIRLAQGRWLVLDLAAGFAATGAESLAGLYDEIIGRTRERVGGLVEPVLRLLAAAGIGPVLPFEVLEAALQREVDHAG